MNESVLNALVHLFAIVAASNRRRTTARGINVVVSYLRRFMNEELIAEYRKVFENYLDFYKRENFPENRRHSKETVQIHAQLGNICRRIKDGLLREERVIVFIHLLEFIIEDGTVTGREEQFAAMVAREFNLLRVEVNNIRAFILEESRENIQKEALLILDNKVREWAEEISWFMSQKTREVTPSKYRYLYVENLYGEILVMNISSINAFILKYRGEQNLYIDSQKIIAGRTYFMKSGSVIRGPNIQPVYFSQIAGKFFRDAEIPPVFLSVKDIDFRFRNSPNGIRQLRFFARSGEMVGIMGGSGVGKSTLLNILIGKLPPDRGKILVNGYDVYRNRNKLEGIIGYVPQDDLLVEELTVFENLYFNAQLCFRDQTAEEHRERVMQILNDLDLAEIKDLKVGNPLNKFISGGQRKRLNFGLELMRKPALLYVDEPTSGLSSMDSLKAMQLLRKQTLQGRLVIANIHQPSSEVFKMFDKLIILDKGGYPVYSGNPVEAIRYFKKISAQVDTAESECSSCGYVNPEQILEIIEASQIDAFGEPEKERKISPEQWNQHYRQNIEPGIRLKENEEPLPENQFAIPSWSSQFVIFFQRNLLSKLADKQYMLINILEAPLLALILGYFTKYMAGSSYIFGENRNIPVFLFMAVVVALFIGLTVSAEEIIKDRKILERESFLNLSRSAYLNSKVSYLFVLAALQTLSFVLIGNAILEIRGMWLSMWIVLFSTACFGNMVGLNISSALDSAVTIYILIPLILVPQLLLGGAMVKFDELHPSLAHKKYVPVIGDIMTTRWAYEALAVTMYRHNRFDKQFYELDQVIGEGNFITGMLIPKLQNMVEEIEWNRETGSETGSESEGIIEENLHILNAELKKLPGTTGVFPYEYISLLRPEDFTEDVSEETIGYLYFVRNNIIRAVQAANQRRDSLYSLLTARLGKEGFDQFRMSYHNQALADQVRNSMQAKKMLVTSREIIKKADPIFTLPESNFGRAHFFAPFKMINDRLIDTLVFNIVIIWFMVFLFYLMLVFDTLRWIFVRGRSLYRKY